MNCSSEKIKWCFFFSFTVSAFFQTFLILFYLKKNLVAKVCMQGSLDLYSLEIWCFDNFFKTHIFEDCLKKMGNKLCVHT